MSGEVKRHRLFGIKRRRLWDFDAAARSAYHELVERDKRYFVGRVEGAPEPVVLVVARGERAAELEAFMQSVPAAVPSREEKKT